MRRSPESIFGGATFDDFLLRPRKSVLASRKDADLAMPLTKNIILPGLPVVPANMRTVTGGRMAAAAALNGTIAFLPRSYSIDQVVERIRQVKSLHAHVIENPLVIHQKATLGEARKLIKDKRISGILVESLKGSGILAGILSRRDLFGPDSARVEEYMTSFDDVKFGRPDISIEDAEKMLNTIRRQKLPLIDDNRRIVGLITMKDLKLAKSKPFTTKDSRGRLVVGATIGARPGSDYIERAEAVISAGADVIMMDVAHAHSVNMEKAIKAFKAEFSGVDLIVGNVATGEGARFLVNLGADAIKVGIGPGRGCRTRLETGFGTPQLEAIREVYLAIGRRVPVMADGGGRTAGDVAKAIACGASTFMLGGLFAGTDEAPGTRYQDPSTGQDMKKYGGETSPEIKLDQYSAIDEPNEDFEGVDNMEGQMRPVPYSGSVTKLLRRLRGSLQSAVSYGGVKRLADFHKELTPNISKYLERLTEASRKESFDR